MEKYNTMNIIFLLSYHPDICNVTNYMFTFLYDHHAQRFKIHGLWAEQCSQCSSCGYPSCCSIDKIHYVYPDDPDNFIKEYWYNTTTTEECTNIKNVILFEHEYYKHISCTDIKSTQEFLEVVKNLYAKYYKDFVDKKCIGHHQLWLNLDNNYKYIQTYCY